jgi:hypothetical protein
MRNVAPRPVFVDRSGRRRRLVVLSGVGLAAVLVAGLVVLFAGLTSGSAWHVPGFPDANRVAELTPSATTQPTEPGAAASAPAPAGVNPGASAEPSSPRRVPTQTPSHPAPKPTKT